MLLFSRCIDQFEALHENRGQNWLLADVIKVFGFSETFAILLTTMMANGERKRFLSLQHRINQFYSKSNEKLGPLGYLSAPIRTKV